MVRSTELQNGGYRYYLIDGETAEAHPFTVILAGTLHLQPILMDTCIHVHAHYCPARVSMIVLLQSPLMSGLWYPFSVLSPWIRLQKIKDCAATTQDPPDDHQPRRGLYHQ